MWANTFFSVGINLLPEKTFYIDPIAKYNKRYTLYHFYISHPP